MQPPAPSDAALRLVVWVALKPLQDVVGLQTQCRSASGSGNRAHTAATQQDHFFTCWYSGLELRFKSLIDVHTGPLLPCYGDCPGYKADPLPLGISAYIDQYSVARLPPGASQLR